MKYVGTALLTLGLLSSCITNSLERQAKKFGYDIVVKNDAHAEHRDVGLRQESWGNELTIGNWFSARGFVNEAEQASYIIANDVDADGNIELIDFYRFHNGERTVHTLDRHSPRPQLSYEEQRIAKLLDFDRLEGLLHVYAQRVEGINFEGPQDIRVNDQPGAYDVAVR